MPKGSVATSDGMRAWREGERAWARWARGGYDLVGLVKAAVRGWLAHGATEMSAAISYYAAFSLSPLLVIAVAVAGLAFGAEQVRQEVVAQFRSMVGDQGAELVGTMLANANQPTHGTIATIISIGALIIGASGAFGQLKEALNRIWEVREKPHGGVWRFFRARFVSFAMVMVIGFLLLTSLVISALLSGVGAWASGALPGWNALLRVINLAVSVVAVTVLFAAVFRYLPDALIRWREVWIGALITAVLFTIGKYLIGVYIGRGSPASVYGAAGSLAVVLIWVYYSSLILLFGAEVTRAHAQRLGNNPTPKGHAEIRQTTGPGSVRVGGGELRT
jgi:membrane protein